MNFNLIDQAWIPVVRRDGRVDRIAPWQMTDALHENPIVTLNASRPDFNGSIIQFLIGLLQTAAPPKTEDAWDDWAENPPSVETLRQCFTPYAHIFDIAGPAGRFMQDYDELDAEEKSVSSLFLEAPGQKTLGDNLDHFVKRGHVNALCPECCALALFTLQTNAPSGGSGNMTSLRGGGPLTTIVLGDGGNSGNLWQTIWLNVLERDVFLGSCGNPKKDSDADKFPWMGPTRTSEKDTGNETTPEDAHPLQVFWGMPRRLRLNLNNTIPGACDICGTESNGLVRFFRQKNHGVDYTGAWRHPLSPYYRDKDGVPRAVHAQPGGVTYRHWLGIVQSDKESGRSPALNVHQVMSRLKDDQPLRIWAYGYDTKDMKARCWYESVMPLITVAESVRPQYEQAVAVMVRTASQVARNVQQSVKSAWFDRPADVRGDMSFIDVEFWQRTEQSFYANLKKIKDEMIGGQQVSPALDEWHKRLHVESLRLFDEWALNGLIGTTNPRRVVIARNDLAKWNYGKKVKALLQLAAGG
jgi:CRISPR system Cascade subunit CasA